MKKNYKINGEVAIIGECQACKFTGLLRPKPVLGAKDLNAITGDTSDSLPILALCVTCYHSPAGVLSDNQTHQRLPEAEYLVK